MELSRKEMWALFLLTESGEVLDMLTEKNGTIQNAVEKLVFEYEQMQKSIIDFYSDMSNARRQCFEVGEILGEVRGNLKGKKNIVVKLLTKKLGGVPLELSEKIDKASEEKFDTIAENIFDVNSVEDVEKLL